VGITGASGACYGLALLKELLSASVEVHLVISDAGFRVLFDEEGIKCNFRVIREQGLPGIAAADITVYDSRDIGARIASGSAAFTGMVICPCSMGTLGAIAHGLSSNLIHRAADVTLKEGRPLLLVPRETPLSSIHLENMLKLSQAGCRIIPAMPGFYHKPESILDVVNMQVMKILDQMGIRKNLVSRWKSNPTEASLIDD
jgi:4-hydroxy-3-polyprenylbenzoate decarboxylase